ncbi:hypothetical protein M407DRAFT_243778 [Tulasnella calospora MUT 4182]|uniref:Uncharacterized protein n=1 Tax=Tulasnella calospora MUT 4182 TaxID=1051891 RepID=A0A0C3LY24_9AGAM|nr:hypothetical protein M407DRAFT_243778 [Tulasnella calospora MUT 4182]
MEDPLPVHVPHQAIVSMKYRDLPPSMARSDWTLFSEASARVCVVGRVKDGSQARWMLFALSFGPSHPSTLVS